MVSVDVTLDFTASTVTTEDVMSASGGGVLRRRESRVGGPNERSSDVGNTTTEVEYQLGRSVSQLTEFPGRIVRVGIGVVVPEGTSAERREAVRELAAVTVGLDEARGDAIAVYSLSAPKPTAPPPEVLPVPGPEPQAAAAAPVGEPRLWYALGGVLLLVVLLRLLFGGRNRVGQTPPPQLTAPEREEILAQVRSWLNEDAARSEAEARRS
jgi:flagellar M-ring protein FliF